MRLKLIHFKISIINSNNNNISFRSLFIATEFLLITKQKAIVSVRLKFKGWRVQGLQTTISINQVRLSIYKWFVWNWALWKLSQFKSNFIVYFTFALILDNLLNDVKSTVKKASAHLNSANSSYDINNPGTNQNSYFHFNFTIFPFFHR